MAVSSTDSSVRVRSDLVRRGQVLEYLTFAACGLEAVVSIVAGLIAGSVALVGFGADSVIEVTSGAALLWRLHHDADIGTRRNAEQITLRIVGGCFLALAAYIVFDSASSLIRHDAPGAQHPRNSRRPILSDHDAHFGPSEKTGCARNRQRCNEC